MSASSTPVDASWEPIPTSSVLMAASKHIAVRCRPENVSFLNCNKDPNPEKCLEKGRPVTRCVLSLESVESSNSSSQFSEKDSTAAAKQIHVTNSEANRKRPAGALSGSVNGR